MIILFVLQITAVIYFLEYSTTPNVPPPGAPIYNYNMYNNHKGTHFFIVIGILSDRLSADQRDAVRETWLKFPVR